MGRVMLAMPAELLPLHPLRVLPLVLGGEVIPVIAVGAFHDDVFARHASSFGGFPPPSTPPSGPQPRPTLPGRFGGWYLLIYRSDEPPIRRSAVFLNRLTVRPEL